jgi:hypothetical protein
MHSTTRIYALDVGPVLRRFLTTADDFFDDLLSLTSVEKLIRGQVPECAVRAVMIVIHPPLFNDRFASLGEAN